MLKIDYYLLALSILFYVSTMLGALVSNILTGMLFSQIFLISFLLLFFASKIDKFLIKKFLEGFVVSGVISAIYIMFQTVFFYLYHINLNEKLFPEFLLDKAQGHILTNFIGLGGIIFFRASGFSWDPAIVASALVFAIILINENIVNFKNFKFLAIIILTIGVLFSLSKTSIIGLFIYYIIKSLKFYKLRITLGNLKISMLSLITIFSFFILLYFGLFLEYTGEGDIRHLKYFSSLFYFFNQNIFEIMFGYGYKGAGEFFNKHVDWFNKDIYGFSFKEGFTPESTLTNIFLWGGLLGSFFWIISYIYIHLLKVQQNLNSYCILL
jgi:hypothetical protein